MNDYQLLTLLISGLAVIIAAVSLIRTRSVNKRQLELQSRQNQVQEEQRQLNRRFGELQSKLAELQIHAYEEAESAKKEAKVTVRLEDTGRPNSYNFIFENEGPAPAYRISWSIQSKTGGPMDFDRDFPKEIPSLDAGHSMTLRAGWDRSVRPPYIVNATWSDGEGNTFERQFELF
jgi:transcription elongation GreA/GreB family factor